MREGLVHLLKQVEPVLDARFQSSSYRIRCHRVGDECVGHTSTEVNPVDGPGVLLVCPECVRSMGRQDYIFVAFHHHRLVVNVYPAHTLCTIDEHGVGYPLLLAYIMILDMGEVTNLADIQIADERVGCAVRHQVFR